MVSRHGEFDVAGPDRVGPWGPGTPRSGSTTHDGSPVSEAQALTLTP